MKKWHIAGLLLILALSGCSKHLDVQLPEAKPETKTTAYSDALRRFGQLTQMWKTSELYVQVEKFMDDTGTAQFTQGEIPIDVTEMVNSAVNRIGGNIRPVAYKPQYLSNQLQLGFSDKGNLRKPDVLIGGGITEYDRGTEIKGDKANAGSNLGPNASFDLSMDKKESTSVISIDMNMIDAQTMEMVPQVQAANTVKVFKVANEAELGFSIFGASFGVSGSVKKIQGKHGAVRVLIELSVLELLGKYLYVPYWKCIGPGATPDPIVLSHMRSDFSAAPTSNKLIIIQRILGIYGFKGLEETGSLDEPTKEALKVYQAAYGVSGNRIDADFYEGLIDNMPLFGDPGRIDKASLDLSRLAPQPAAANPEAAKSRLNKFMQ